MARKIPTFRRRAACEPLEERRLLAADLVAADVLVLYNPASADSVQIASYYAQVHPGVHLLGLSGVDPSKEDISADQYLSVIRPQVLSALTPSIDVIVTTKGLPLRIAVTEPQPAAVFPNLPTYVDPSGVTRSILVWQPFSSLESELADIDRVSTWQMMGDQSYVVSAHFAINPYFRSTAPFSYSTYGIRLTSRLDGYTASDVIGSIGRAQQAFVGPSNSSSGPYFLVDNDPTISYAPSMANLVNSVLRPAGLPVVYDNTTAFVGTAPGPIIGYDSHGVHQGSTPANYITSGVNVALANGAVFTSWESYNAYSFKPGGYSGGQGQIGQWLQKGGTAAVGNVEEPGASFNTVVNEDQMFKMLLAGRTFAESAWSALRQLSYVNTIVGDPLMTWKVLPPAGVSTVAGRYVFYNDSLWDGRTTAASAADDAAIAPDKSALLPDGTTATFTNITSYARGINGIMVDISGSHSNITAKDFTFRVGANNAPSTWAAAPAPTAISVRAGAGVGGSDRVEIIWNNGAITNTWLEVTVAADANTGLAAPDVFYFGNRIGDIGNSAAGAAVTGASDLLGVRANQGGGASLSNVYDFNRTGIVNASDQVILTGNFGTLLKINISSTSAVPQAVASITVADQDADPQIFSTVSPQAVAADTSLATSWFLNRLQQEDSIVRATWSFVERPAQPNTPPGRAVLVAVDAALHQLGLDDEFLGCEFFGDEFLEALLL